MLINEPVYDLDLLARNNLHIHTIYSPCAKREMVVADIVAEAVKNDIRMISFTDHYNSKEFKVLDTNSDLREQVEQCDSNITVLYGAELSAYGVDKFLDDVEINQALDYRLYSYNHYHLDYWEQPQDRSPRGYVDHAIAVLESLFKTDRADCIAHPFIGRFIRHLEDRTLVTKAITDNELGDIMELGMNSQVAWEINVNAMIADPEFAKRYWNIGKEAGVVFNYGTDAHRLDAIDTRQYVDQLKEILQ